MHLVSLHTSDERLELYALSRLPDSDTAVIEEHLLLCEPCRIRLDETAVFARSMRDGLKWARASEHRPGLSGVRFGGAAGWLTSLKPRLAMAGALAAMIVTAMFFPHAGTAHLPPVASLELLARRSGEVKTIEMARELDLFLTDSAGASRIEVFQTNGGNVWSGPVEQGKPAEAKVRQILVPGQYLARTYSGLGQELHEYTFRVQNKRIPR